MYDSDSIKNAEQTDLNTKHHFTDNVYAKEMTLPAGHVALSHKHSYSHLSCLAKGKVILMTDGEVIEFTGPAMIEIKAGVEHQIEAVEDSVWYCIHATTETDHEQIDRVAISNESV